MGEWRVGVRRGWAYHHGFGGIRVGLVGRGDRCLMLLGERRSVGFQGKRGVGT